MPAAKPPEFRRRAVDLARSGDHPVANFSSDSGTSGSRLRRWMAIEDVDAGREGAPPGSGETGGAAADHWEALASGAPPRLARGLCC